MLSSLSSHLGKTSKHALFQQAKSYTTVRSTIESYISTLWGESVLDELSILIKEIDDTKTFVLKTPNHLLATQLMMSKDSMINHICNALPHVDRALCTVHIQTS